MVWKNKKLTLKNAITVGFRQDGGFFALIANPHAIPYHAKIRKSRIAITPLPRYEKQLS